MEKIFISLGFFYILCSNLPFKLSPKEIERSPHCFEIRLQINIALSSPSWSPDLPLTWLSDLSISVQQLLLLLSPVWGDCYRLKMIVPFSQKHFVHLTLLTILEEENLLVILILNKYFDYSAIYHYLPNGVNHQIFDDVVLLQFCSDLTESSEGVNFHLCHQIFSCQPLGRPTWWHKMDEISSGDMRYEIWDIIRLCKFYVYNLILRFVQPRQWQMTGEGFKNKKSLNCMRNIAENYFFLKSFLASEKVASSV